MLGMHAEVGDAPVPASDAGLGEPQVGCWVAELGEDIVRAPCLPLTCLYDWRFAGSRIWGKEVDDGKERWGEDVERKTL